MPLFSRNILLLLTVVLLSGQSVPVQAREMLPQAGGPYRKGILAAQQQDYKLALRYLLDAERADPDSPELYFYLGLASSKLPGYELRALAWFQLYLMKVPDTPKAAAIREQIGALEVSFESRLGKMLDRLEPLLAADKSPTGLRNVFYLGFGRGYFGDFEGGLSVVRSATGKESWQDASDQNPEVRNRLDNLFTNLLLKNCSDQDKFFAEVGSNGLKLSVEGFDETQLPDYLRGLENRKNPEQALATVLSDLARVSIIYRAINGTFDPGRRPDSYWAKLYAIAYQLRGTLRSMCPEYRARSIDDFSKSIEIEAKSARGYHLRGRTFGYLKNYAKAIEDSSKAIEIDPKDADSYGVRGSAYAGQGNYAKAIEDYSKDIELDPKVAAQVYCDRGTAYSYRLDYPRAIEDFNKAIEMDPKSTDAYVKRGWAHASQADYRKALEDYDKALELDPNHAEAAKGRDEARVKARHLPAQDQAEPATDPGMPPAPGTPQKQLSEMGREVLKHLEDNADFKDLQSLYNEQSIKEGWPAGSEGTAVMRRLNRFRADVAETEIVATDRKRALQYCVNGSKVVDAGIAVSGLERSPQYRSNIAEAIAQSILTTPADAQVQAALERFRAARK